MNPMDNTPILIGAGQFTEYIDSAEYRGLSAVEIAAAAARAAIDDASDNPALLGDIDFIGSTRTFEDSSPVPAPFGKVKNFPRALAKRLGINPRNARWVKAGGNSPQQLVSEVAEQLAEGRFKIALIAGAEAISSVRHLLKLGEKRDWSDATDGPVQNDGWGLKGMISQYTQAHGLTNAPNGYALCEHARQTQLGLSNEAYAQQMGVLFAPFTEVAAQNPYSSTHQAPRTARELTTPGEGNRMIASPYPQRLVARDQVNQGAALLLTTVEKARALQIPEDKWVYLHGYSDMHERDLLERADLSRSPAARLAVDIALKAAGLGVSDIGYFDFYSCFPIAVFNVAVDHLGLSPADPRKLTVTGGLPYFGGPGNNYSMHAIATIVQRLRKDPSAYGLVGANGGILSKYSVGIYSCRPREWQVCDSSAAQASVDAAPAPPISLQTEGAATIETYTVAYDKGAPAKGIIVGRLTASNERFMAMTFPDDRDTVEALLGEGVIGRTVYVTNVAQGNRFAFNQTTLAAHTPAEHIGFKNKYEYCLIERRGHVLEVTINRPEARNCLNPMANDELDSIFNAFEADDGLWVAILTGAGDAAFCTGNDLKYTASGKPMWVPKNGFAGLTSRPARKKPVIAAVNGFAMGGGLEICLACDIIIADEAAQFALSEVRVGLFAGAGGLVRLPRQLPKKLAVELILTGRKFGADFARQHGLIGSIAAKGKALERAREIADEILEASPTSVRLSLQVMQGAEKYSDITQALRSQAPVVDELVTSEDMYEGVTAFATKRKPEWKNR